MKRLKPKFVEFLKYHGVHDVFEINFKNSDCGGTLSDPECTDYDIVHTDIKNAFTWDDTPQGIKFWEDIHNAYEDIFKQ